MLTRAMAVFVLGATALPVVAKDFVVTRTDDPAPGELNACTPLGGCSLRQAVLAANKRSGADRVILGRHEYLLTRTTASESPDGRSGPLWITDDLEIVGEGPTRTRVRWSLPPYRTYPHQVVWSDVDVPLELTSLTLSHGRGRYGGCVMAYGDLTLADSVIEQCRAERGGAIQLGSVVMSLVDATLRDNHATGSGGAIALFGGTTIIADGARIEDNTAAGDGGAISGSGAFSYTPSAAAVWRNVGASSVFARNHADGNGGAVAMHGYFSFNLFVFPSDGPRIVFEDNTATGRGGAFDVDPAGNPVAWSRLTLEHALLTGNQALYGGGIASRGQILVNESEFADNIAQGTLQVPGRGGAIWTEHVSTSQIGDAEIRRSSFNSNGARGDGGAIASTCVPLRLTDVSLYDNHTYSGNGSAVASSGNTLLTHVTTYHHNTGTTVQSTLAKKHHTACGSQPFLLANSIVGGHDTCYGMSGAFSSSGGNQYGPQGGGCYLIAGKDQWNTDPEVFGLTLGTYGGLRNVLGWTGTPPQKNYGQAATCTTSDVRGLPRNDGACDSGAFEQQP